jgi:hypothetical protein
MYFIASKLLNFVVLRCGFYSFHIQIRLLLPPNDSTPLSESDKKNNEPFSSTTSRPKKVGVSKNGKSGLNFYIIEFKCLILDYSEIVLYFI